MRKKRSRYRSPGLGFTAAVPGDPERLLTPIQLAQRLQIGGSTVKRMVYANRIPVMRVGARGVLRFSWVDVIAALKPKPEPDKG